MNDIVNKFLLAADRFMPEMHLKQPQFTYSACGPFKACFQHDMAYGDFKDLTRGTTADKVLRDKAFNIAKDPKYDGIQIGLASMVYKFFDKKNTGSGIKSMQKNEIIRKFKKRKVYSTFKYNISGADLADMQLIIKFNKALIFLLCVIDILSKYAWVVSLKDKKFVTIINSFQNFLDDSKRKPNKIWVDKGSKFYNRSMKS